MKRKHHLVSRAATVALFTFMVHGCATVPNPVATTPGSPGDYVDHWKELEKSHGQTAPPFREWAKSVLLHWNRDREELQVLKILNEEQSIKESQ